MKPAIINVLDLSFIYMAGKLLSKNLKMTKKTKLILISLCLLPVAVIIWLIFIFPTSSLCLSPDKIHRMSTKSAIFSPEGSDIAFAQWEIVVQTTHGICNFPDGPGGRTLAQQVSIYKNSVDIPNKPVLLSVIPISNDYSANDGYRLLGWKDNNIYLSIYIISTRGDMKHKKTYYRIDANSGKIFHLKDSEGATVEAEFPRENTLYHPKDKTMWLLNREDNGLGIYTNEKGAYQGAWPEILKKSIVDKDVLYNLSTLPYTYKRVDIY